MINRIKSKITETFVYVISLGIKYVYFPLMNSFYKCYYSICDDDSSDFFIF